jgi:hypothetical protein
VEQLAIGDTTLWRGERRRDRHIRDKRATEREEEGEERHNGNH